MLETLSFSVVSHPTVPSIQIPNADLLLHADCNEQEVVCEISRYVPRGAELDSLPAHFIGSIQLEGGGISLTLVLQTLHSETTQSDTQPLMQSKLNLPLSQSGTLQTEGNIVICYLSIYETVYTPKTFVFPCKIVHSPQETLCFLVKHLHSHKNI